MPATLPLDQVTDHDRASVGGKAFQLAKLIQAGLPVPPGFTIKAEALESLHDPSMRAEILAAYRDLGGGPVAVRSSAVFEDSAEISFAGQFETVLDVRGEDALIAAVERCMTSSKSDRVRAYQRQIGAQSIPTLGVIVQRFVKSEVAGVLFTRDPSDEAAMLAEIGFESEVVSGIEPAERVRIDRASRSVREPMNHKLPIEKLVDLGLRIEALFQSPCDIEWAFDGQQLWVLQARPITSADAAERTAIVREEIEHARSLAERGGTVWVRQSLADVLPHPTPMTWALVQRMLSGDGGLGRMYRDFGCKPDPALSTIGVYDLISGRPYLNLSREPRMQYGNLPLGHSFARLKANPAAAVGAQAGLLPERVGLGTLLTWPIMGWRLRRMLRKIAGHARNFARRFREEIAPPFLTACVAESRTDYTALSTPDVLVRFRQWCEIVLGEFARHSLKAAALADRLSRTAKPADLAGLRLDAEVDVAGGLRALATGKMHESEFLESFGHRGPHEMELSQPRFDEAPPIVTQHSASKRDSKHNVTGTSADRLREVIELRETAKHWLMFGTAQLRRQLVELDRRFNLHGGIFFLTPGELPRLAVGEQFTEAIAARRRRWAVLKSLPIPAVLFSDDLGTIGRAPDPPPSAPQIMGIGLSAGVGEGPAQVLSEPALVETSGYVLVCPTSEPAWTPLMLSAGAVVFESGGVLSHGAIVAREFGVPAVGGISDATRRFKNGQRLRVDGGSGNVTILPGRVQTSLTARR
jgi:rifampicin phosphotransferase